MTEVTMSDLSNCKTPEEEKRFWKQFEYQLAHDDGAAAKAHLAAGRPITYDDDRYPDGIVREYPDGRKELVDVDMAAGGIITVLRQLAPPAIATRSGRHTRSGRSARPFSN